MFQEIGSSHGKIHQTKDRGGMLFYASLQIKCIALVNAKQVWNNYNYKAYTALAVYCWSKHQYIVKYNILKSICSYFPQDPKLPLLLHVVKQIPSLCI